MNIYAKRVLVNELFLRHAGDSEKSGCLASSSLNPGPLLLRGEGADEELRGRPVECCCVI
jgi:hypothetical protein